MKNLFGQTVNVKAYLISRVIVILLTVATLYFAFNEHYKNIGTSILSLLVVLLSVIMVIASIGITVHAFRDRLNDDKKTN